MAELERTGLHDLHVELGAKMVPFAGYEMPVQYSAGVMTEHLHTRAKAGLFDVSHMGQVILRGDGRSAALETLVPADVIGLAEGRQRYGFFTNPEGGLLDDLMIANRGDHLFLVVNAARKAHDIAHLETLPDITVEPVTDRALLALQGPMAEAVLAEIVPEVRPMRFMDVITVGDLWISRSGYTGEDGFEISVPLHEAENLARRLIADEYVLPIGLGARDSLRLEAGLCLHGNDISEQTNPYEAGLGWLVKLEKGDFIGRDALQSIHDEGPSRQLVGFVATERGIPRHDHVIQSADGETIGAVTSGTQSPVLEAGIGLGYVPNTPAYTEPGQSLQIASRRRTFTATVKEPPLHKDD